jgi:hypothetical protein
MTAMMSPTIIIRVRFMEYSLGKAVYKLCCQNLLKYISISSAECPFATRLARICSSVKPRLRIILISLMSSTVPPTFTDWVGGLLRKSSMIITPTTTTPPMMR